MTQLGFWDGPFPLGAPGGRHWPPSAAAQRARHEPQSTEPWHYQWQREGFVECIGQRRRVFGHWSCLFGCWEQDSADAPHFEVLPDWPIVDRRGAPLGHSVGATSPQLVAAGRIFAAYLDGVPLSLRRLAAPFGYQQWLIMDLIWQVPMFARVIEGCTGEGASSWLRYYFAAEGLMSGSRAKRRTAAQRLVRILDRDSDWSRDQSYLGILEPSESGLDTKIASLRR